MVVLLLSTRCVFFSQVQCCFVYVGVWHVRRFESASATIIASVVEQVLSRRTVEKQVLSRRSEGSLCIA